MYTTKNIHEFLPLFLKYFDRGHRAIIDDGAYGGGSGGYIDGDDDSGSGFVADNGGDWDDDIGGGLLGLVMMMIF
jgi:hypothetical protein